MGAGNPFWDVHDAFWDILEAHAMADSTGFADLVASRKRHKLIATTRDALNEEIAITPDTCPAVAIVQAGLRASDRMASNCTAATLVWRVVIYTGDRRFESLFDVHWAVFRALMGWDDTLHALTWEGEPYVGDCNLLEAQDDEYNRALMTKGWDTTWTGSTELYFAHDTLVTVDGGT